MGNRVMPVCNNYSIKDFLPPDVNIFDGFVFSECQCPLLVPLARCGSDLRKVLDGSIEHEERVCPVN